MEKSEIFTQCVSKSPLQISFYEIFTQKSIMVVINEKAPKRSFMPRLLIPLSKCRETLTSEFALKLVKNEKFSSMFQPRSKNIQTRSRAVFQEEKPNSKRFYMSAIPYMTRILNGKRN